MTSHRYTSSRAHHDVTGIRKSGRSWSEINGPIGSSHACALGRLAVAGAGLAALFVAVGVLMAMVP
jgi:hypothetical protein